MTSVRRTLQRERVTAAVQPGRIVGRMQRGLVPRPARVLAAVALVSCAAACDAPPADGPARPGRAAGDVFRDCYGCPEMVVVPAGAFVMGTPPVKVPPGVGKGEEAQRWERVRAFAVGVYEVTFAEWDACVEAGGCRGYSPDDEGWGRGSRPVMNVNLGDARAYVRWLSGRTGREYRLPTQAEWEYAARAGTRTMRYWGDDAGKQCAYANGFDATANAEDPNHFAAPNAQPADCIDGHHRTAPVGSFAPNPFGLYDVLGNVREWNDGCWTHPAKRPNFIDLLGWFCTNRRVTRGGSWGDVPGLLRSAWRGAPDGGTRHPTVGFRVARTME